MKKRTTTAIKIGILGESVIYSNGQNRGKAPGAKYDDQTVVSNPSSETGIVRRAVSCRRSA